MPNELIVDEKVGLKHLACGNSLPSYHEDSLKLRTRIHYDFSTTKDPSNPFKIGFCPYCGESLTIDMVGI